MLTNQIELLANEEIQILRALTGHNGRIPLGRPFLPGLEAELMPNMLELASGLATRNCRIIAIPELVAPFGVADLTVLKTTDRRLSRRDALDAEPFLSEIDAVIAGSLDSRRAMTVSEIATISGFDASSLERRLRALARSGAVRATRGGKWRKPAALRPLGSVHAFEAKLRDWRRGLDQAATYALWADTVSIVLDRLPSDDEPLVNAASIQGVGIAVRGSWLIRPSMLPHSVGRRMWASEHVYSYVRGHQNTQTGMAPSHAIGQPSSRA